MQQSTKQWLRRIVMIVTGCFLLIILAGVYRFNLTDDDIYVESNSGQVIAYNEIKALKSLDFIPVTEAAIKEQLNQIDFFAGETLEPLTYAKHAIDLNNDDVDEWLLVTEATEICGTGGCPIFVIRWQGEQPILVAEFSPAHAVSVNEVRTNGWKNLYFTVADGGSASAIVKMFFDGSRYVYDC